MLEKTDLSKTIDNQEYGRLIDELRIRLGELQREAWNLRIPIIIVFEGWHASGMSEIINKFVLALNPVGFDLYSIGKPSPEEEKKPLIWRFWTKIPQKGRIAIFDRSWYRRALLEHFSTDESFRNMNMCLNGINYMERQLSDDGYLIIKMFLHTSKDVQIKRFKEMEKRDIPLFLLEEENDFLEQYEKVLSLQERILEKTDSPGSPWTIIESNDRKFAIIKSMITVVEQIQNCIDQTKVKQAQALQLSKIEDNIKTNEDDVTIIAASNTNSSNPEENEDEVCYTGITCLNASVLQKVDLDKSMAKPEYKKKRKKFQKMLRDLQYDLFKNEIPVIILFEGWDASGKGGNIRRIAEKLNPRLYRVVPIGVPNEVEIAKHYLWRFYKELPKTGHLAIFDRSWYGRVLVERVESLCKEEEWKRAYREINEFEDILTGFGYIVIKFWLHIDRDEQLSRFKSREEISYKKWKITPEDWRNRDKWYQYEEAIDEMLQKTSTTYSPWTIIEANDKYYARVKVLETIVNAVQENLALKEKISE